MDVVLSRSPPFVEIIILQSRPLLWRITSPRVESALFAMLLCSVTLLLGRPELVFGQTL